MAPATKPQPTKRNPPDSFQLARSIYNRRKTLQAKADWLLADADDTVRKLVEAIEEQDAKSDQRFAEVDPDLPTDD